jgi:hypothetical protein
MQIGECHRLAILRGQVNCGAGPITGNPRLPSAPYAGSAVGKTSNANATRNAADVPAFSLLAGKFTGKNRIGANFISDNTIFINVL